MYWRRPGVDFATANRDDNRDGLRALVDGSIAPGLVAIDDDGRAVGWVSLGPREDFHRLERSRVRPRLDDVPVWSIVCFVVARRARRRGVASGLLDGAIAYARQQGAPALEAYPVDPTQGRPTAATLYTGPLSMFRRAGFRVVREVVSPRSTVTRQIVRLDLDARSSTGNNG